MKNPVIILIIAHKQHLSEEEKESLRQCYKILGNYQVRLICPMGLDVSEYKRVNDECAFFFIDPAWQSSYEMFNRLKIDKLLYEKFCDYKYILFYELDAWVFRDELAAWCNKGHDYVGAPWFEGWNNAVSKEFAGAGNGGFSLRKVKAFLKVKKKIDFILRKREQYYRYPFLKKIGLKRWLGFFGFFSNFRYDKDVIDFFYSPSHVHEDVYWVKKIPLVFPWFKVAEPEEALKFSFEVHPEYLYKKNHNKLPFGCHAWQRYEKPFWTKFISAGAVENQ